MLLRKHRSTSSHDDKVFNPLLRTIHAMQQDLGILDNPYLQISSKCYIKYSKGASSMRKSLPKDKIRWRFCHEKNL